MMGAVDIMKGREYFNIVKVLFDHPNPFLLAHGGFQIQIEQTKKALEAAGVEVEWLRWWDDGQKGDLIHYFGRPHPAYIRQAHAKGIKVVMSELLTGLGSRSGIARKAQKTFINIAKNVLPHEFVTRFSWDAYQTADACIALTSWEKELMVEMFSAQPERVHVVPNGVEEIFFSQAESKAEKSKYLVCTATITERKRVVELAEAAMMAQVPVWIIGEPYSKEDPYYRKFLSVVRTAGEIVRYEGGISARSTMAAIYQNASGFVLLSSMESLSLSALEAAAGGCRLFLADLPWARSSFGATATYSRLGSKEEETRNLKAFYQNREKAPKPPRPCRWGDVGKQLCRIYEGLLADKTSR
jgi:glycosyltransferase involved in cell wall biosynthesis